MFNQSRLISVVVPVYNVSAYVEECLNSILAQTYTHFEVIIVNDGSTDDSLEKCHLFAHDSRVKIIDKANEGLSVARQTGFDAAQGDFICTIDSDDMVHPHYLASLYRRMYKTDADICVCSRLDFDEHSAQPVLLSETYSTVLSVTNLDLHHHYCDLARRYVMGDSWNKMYRTSFLRQTGVKFFLSRDYNGTDLLFNHLLLLHKPRLTQLDEPLYLHRFVPTSRVNRRNKKMREGFCFIFDALVQEAERLNLAVILDEQFSVLFYILQAQAAKDLYQEYQTASRTERVAALDDFVRENVAFSSAYPGLNLAVPLTAHRLLNGIQRAHLHTSGRTLYYDIKLFKAAQRLNRIIKKIKRH